MEKKEVKTIKKFLIFMLCVVLLGVACFATYAWFTDSQTFESSNLDFGTIKLDVSGDNVDGSTISADVARKSGTITSKLMPGDTVSIKFDLSLKSGSEPAYYLMFLTGVNNLFDELCYYYDSASGTLATASETNQNVGLINVNSDGTPEIQHIEFSKTIPTTTTHQGGKVQAKLQIFAIQQANVSESVAFEELYVKGAVQLPAYTSIRNALGGADSFKTFTKVSFLNSAQINLSEYSLDETKTTDFNSYLSSLYKNKNLIQVYTNNSNSLDVAIVSNATMLAPSDCGLFQDCSALTSVDFSNFNTKNVTTMAVMFKNCSALTSVDVSGFCTSNVTNMQVMFYNCEKLTSLDVSSFNTSSVNNMAQMFQGCKTLTTLDVSSFDTSNVSYMNSMFEVCSGLTSLDLSNFNTSKVTSMIYMFASCSGLTHLDVSSFNTSKVVSMSSMFSGCSSLKSLDLSSFNTQNVTNWEFMFYNTCKNNASTATLTISSNFTYQNDSGEATQFTKATLNSKTNFNKTIKLVRDGAIVSV